MKGGRSKRFSPDADATKVASPPPFPFAAAMGFIKYGGREGRRGGTFFGRCCC